MNSQNPKPTKINVLSRLKRHLPITSIVDVGVREKTGELIFTFPELKHYLFEPVSDFYETIRKNYNGLDYQLYSIALSDESSEIYLIIRSLEKNGQPTHSAVSSFPEKVDGTHILSCTPIEVRRFDELDVSQNIANNFLLKVDVDGKDLNVLQGFGESIRNASAIIVECTMYNMLERMSFVRNAGFVITDLVDLVYYGDSLWQFDAVLVRNDLISEKIKPPISEFDRSLWYPINF